MLVLPNHTNGKGLDRWQGISRPFTSEDVSRLRNTFEVLRIPADEFERERDQVVERNVRLFGTGRDGPER